MWTYRLLGLPIGFPTLPDWIHWVNCVIEDSGLIEGECCDAKGHPIGYFAYQEGYCIHHKGKVLDIQMLVLSPSCKETRQVWKSILESAKRNGYSWVARRQHQYDGSIKTIFTEVQ